ncbi:hypothetical protein ACU8KH_00006 [Lachancea thermotolerans]
MVQPLAFLAEEKKRFLKTLVKLLVNLHTHMPLMSQTKAPRR